MSKYWLNSNNTSYLPLGIFLFFQLIDLPFAFVEGWSGRPLQEVLFIIGASILILSLGDIRKNYYPFFKQQLTVTKGMKVNFHTLMGTNLILLLNLNAVFEKPRILFILGLMLSPAILIYIFLSLLVFIRKMRGDQD